MFSIEDFEPIDTSNEELNNIKVAKGDKALELVDNCEVKSFDEAVIEIKKLKGEGLGNTAMPKAQRSCPLRN